MNIPIKWTQDQVKVVDLQDFPEVQILESYEKQNIQHNLPIMGNTVKSLI